MPELIVEDMQLGYIELLEYVRRHGVRRSPRGLPTWDVEDLTIVLKNPKRSLTEYIGRKASTRLAALEALQLVAGESWPDLMVKVAPNTKQFLNDAGVFHGAYGPRLLDAIPLVVDSLSRDGDTRQAIATIFDTKRDLRHVGERDVPCTVALYYKIVDGRLHAKTNMRSNDCIWGVAHDIFMFTILQRTIAAFMNLKVGLYRHNAYSMHMYHRDDDIFDRLHEPTKVAQVAPPIYPAELPYTWLWGDVREHARKLAAGTHVVDKDPNCKWWSEVAKTWLENPGMTTGENSVLS